MNCFSIRFFLCFIALCAGASGLSGEEKKARYTVQGEVPEGWEVVESSDAPTIEKWVELKNGERKKLFLKAFVLKPVAVEESKFSVRNPLQTASGQKLEEVLEVQNENLSQTEEELGGVLARLKSLLSALPAQSELKKES